MKENITIFTQDEAEAITQTATNHVVMVPAFKYSDDIRDQGSGVGSIKLCTGSGDEQYVIFSHGLPDFLAHLDEEAYDTLDSAKNAIECARAAHIESLVDSHIVVGEKLRDGERHFHQVSYLNEGVGIIWVDEDNACTINIEDAAGEKYDGLDDLGLYEENISFSDAVGGFDDFFRDIAADARSDNQYAVKIDYHYTPGVGNAPPDDILRDEDGDEILFDTMSEAVARADLQDKEVRDDDGVYHLSHGEYDSPAFSAVIYSPPTLAQRVAKERDTITAAALEKLQEDADYVWNHRINGEWDFECCRRISVCFGAARLPNDSLSIGFSFGDGDDTMDDSAEIAMIEYDESEEKFANPKDIENAINKLLDGMTS